MRTLFVPALGRNVSVAGFGCASLGSRISASAGQRALGLAFDLGITWFDTAPPYGDGQAESILGAAFRGQRDKIVICTKFGIARPHVSLPKRLLRPVARKLVAMVPTVRTAVSKARPVGQRTPIHPDAIETSVNESLRQLKTDYIDVLAIHEPVPAEASSDAIHAAIGRLVQAGKVRAVSVAGTTDSILACRASGHSLDFAQFPDNPFISASEVLRAGFAGSPAPVFITHSVFGSGIAERMNSLSPAVQAAIAEAAGGEANSSASVSRLLLPFAFSNNPDGVVILSMFSPGHIRSNCAAAGQQPSPALAGRLRAIIQNEGAPHA